MYSIYQTGYQKDKQVELSKRFFIANGYFRAFGHMDESLLNISPYIELLGKDNQLVEPVQIPNPFLTYIETRKGICNADNFKPYIHEQELDMKNGVYRRKTTFHLEGALVSIESERFVDQMNQNLFYSSFSFSASTNLELDIYTGIDTLIDTTNQDMKVDYNQDVLSATISSNDSKLNIAKRITTNFRHKFDVVLIQNRLMYHYRIKMIPSKIYTIFQFMAISENDQIGKALEMLKSAHKSSYKVAERNNKKWWKQTIDLSSIDITGNDQVDTLSKNAVYHLISLRPVNDQQIPMYRCFFAMPFYLNTSLKSARLIVKQFINYLEYARRYATSFGQSGANYGFMYLQDGAYYYINGLISQTIEAYLIRTFDDTVLIEGGLNVLYEIAQYYIHNSGYNEANDRYVILNSKTLDELHKQVDNDAFTLYLAKASVDIFITKLMSLKKTHKKFVNLFLQGKEESMKQMREYRQKIDMPFINKADVIEQFKGYFELKDPYKKILKLKVKKTTENEQIIPVASNSTQKVAMPTVSLLLVLLNQKFSDRIYKANFEYYQKRTESTSFNALYANALLGSYINETALGLDLIDGSLTIDELTNSHSFHQNELTISGGIYSLLVHGFSRLTLIQGFVKADYNLPKGINGISFKAIVNQRTVNVKVKNYKVEVIWEGQNDV